MVSRLFIHAANVHQGGGHTLLTAILDALPAHVEFILSVDTRVSLSLPTSNPPHVQLVRPTVLQRLIAEFWLASKVKSDDVVLCFGNLPPLFKLKGRTVVFVQNRYLAEQVPLRGFNFRNKLKIMAERLWLSLRSHTADEFVVQTPSMQTLLANLSKGQVPVKLFPFAALQEDYSRKQNSERTQDGSNVDFLYVASGEAHKNHRRLIEAWVLLAQEGIFPSLCLTLNPDLCVKLYAWIQQVVKKNGIRVENLPLVPHAEMFGTYRRASALIYPSMMESLGLPLIEARQAGIAVLASELDYVRDVIDPEQTFDPESSISIARAVKRFMRIDESMLPLQDAKTFVAHVLSAGFEAPYQ